MVLAVSDTRVNKYRYNPIMNSRLPVQEQTDGKDLKINKYSALCFPVGILVFRIQGQSAGHSRALLSVLSSDNKGQHSYSDHAGWNYMLKAVMSNNTTVTLGALWLETTSPTCITGSGKQAEKPAGKVALTFLVAAVTLREFSLGHEDWTQAPFPSSCYWSIFPLSVADIAHAPINQIETNQSLPSCKDSSPGIWHMLKKENAGRILLRRVKLPHHLLILECAKTRGFSTSPERKLASLGAAGRKCLPARILR
ncbi:uncharacterized protein CLUP02_00508 [Colletotrichum lupini]|uniref:Uncharacterized protein n=1 Tax=Colletotrichum lupini TaxID=145971 RepID=A0A9Q8SAH4_9PEZI|nr:uncharacterized protein CLUP02_00508 [Colletotrichum lupini]UQC73861.1 hypothetical protein CLUP02_00508 [Colletotrichum lupini]